MGLGRDLRGRRKDGTEFPAAISLSPFPMPDGLHVIAVVRDETESHRLVEQSRQAQKMESIGRLAGGVAHDFNNLLTVIGGCADRIVNALGFDHQARQDLEEIRRAASRASDLTRQLLAFSRRQVLAPEVLSLNRVVADMERLLRRLIGEDIELRTVLAPDLGNVRADPGQLEQVIVNLAVNAQDAMPQGGSLTIETANARLDESRAWEHVSLRPGPYAMLAISDTGVGIDPAAREHLFEPFFTTKEMGKGTGLGLATVYGIVKQSEGYIWVYSEPGHGTTFKIYLPEVDDSPTWPRAAKPEARSARGTETVLVAEDNAAVRSLVGRTLTEAGYAVLEAATAADALTLAREYPGRIHLLLSDVVLPGEAGTQLAKGVASLRPGLRILYMSGYTNDAVLRRGILAHGQSYLQKPFAPADLLRQLRRALDAQQPT
jgi:signal transduction histidine kinase/ActR/RegA family two-component response regulator